ncbi:hypothetical protein IQ07DRAFT_599245 [Pyrenochaeta sp. DS3sAY3a]|nr:hypothetical protein IQ07DRAFT_599245 [Pyrenochaeta sp. DS3sAY3a]
MGTFHNNKLNTISIDDPDDQDYTPATPPPNKKSGRKASSAAKNMSTPKADGSSTKRKRKRGNNSATAKQLEESKLQEGSTHRGGNGFENFNSISQLQNDGYSTHLQQGNYHDIHNSLAMAQVSPNAFNPEEHNPSWAYNHQLNLQSQDNLVAHGLEYVDSTHGNLTDKGLFHHNDSFDLIGTGSFGNMNQTPGDHHNASGVQDFLHNYNNGQADEIHSDDITRPVTPEGSEYRGEDSDEERAAKTFKNNKGGTTPRKPRDPRPKLIKWDDNDWKNAVIGIVYSCGENDVRIPFDQAAQFVSPTCTAGALQQALLKLRDKLIAEGYQIPPLKMSWHRRSTLGSLDTSSSISGAQQSTPAKTPKRKQHRARNRPSHVVVLKRPYRESDRCNIASPYKFNKGVQSDKSASFDNAEKEDKDGLIAGQMPLGVAAGINHPVLGSIVANEITPFSTPPVINPYLQSGTDTGLRSNATHDDSDHKGFNRIDSGNPQAGGDGSSDGMFAQPKMTWATETGFGPLLHDRNYFGAVQLQTPPQELAYEQHEPFRHPGISTQGFSSYHNTPSKQNRDSTTYISFNGPNGSTSNGFNNFNGVNTFNTGNGSNSLNTFDGFNAFNTPTRSNGFKTSIHSNAFDASNGSNGFSTPANRGYEGGTAGTPANSGDFVTPTNTCGQSYETSATRGSNGRLQSPYFVPPFINPLAAPVTPPVSVRAELAVAESLNSQLREQGAFMPQASQSQNYHRHDLDNAFIDEDNEPFNSELFDHLQSSMDFSDDKVPVTMFNVEDPFLDFKP